MSRRTMRAGVQHQQGMATLLIVAVLFFVLSLVAAYTNRSLIFEQRTSGNQYRSTQAFEAAEAGMEWALSMLNAGRIDDACVPSTDPTLTSFRQRYLTIDADSGVIDAAGVLSAAPDFGSTVWPSCVFDGTNWVCSCPTAGAPVLAAPGGAGVFPAFRVRFTRASTSQPGIVRLEVNGCTRLDDNCLDFPSQAVGGEGRSTVKSLIALRNGLAAVPVAAISVRGNLNVGGAALGAYNTEPWTAGVTVLAGGSTAGSTNLQLGSAPGTPGAQTVIDNDPGLQSLSGGPQMFSSTFAAPFAVYRDQPGAVHPTCFATCNAADVRSAAALNPGKPIWIAGDLDLDSGGDVGSIAEPLLIVAEGNVQVAVRVYGLIYSRGAPNWVSSGAGGEVRGAVVAENGLSGSGSFAVHYDTDVLRYLRWQTGSFVRVPGGWRDF